MQPENKDNKGLESKIAADKAAYLNDWQQGRLNNIRGKYALYKDGKFLRACASYSKLVGDLEQPFFVAEVGEHDTVREILTYSSSF